ncbi:MAG TPA: type III secretion system export apparatus subunit SctR [Anaeromyxobacteraceae bacterium]|nr:type III secretion system export apparatus subunit SctR [Anaeromyxobacteraceae bacterium]
MTPLVALPRTGLAGDRPVELLLLLGLMALVPLTLVTLTSFVKIAVVLSVARSALGAPQVPPTTAVTGLALLLSLSVMAPVAEDAWRAARAGPPPRGADELIAAGARAAAPLKAFLARFAKPEDRRLFLDLSRRLRPAEERERVVDADLLVLAPAFMVSELRRAFAVGFLVFLPFLAVDLAVANVLLALGLTQLSPTAVSLPFKLLLFVAVDGWALLSRGLVASYLP